MAPMPLAYHLRVYAAFVDVPYQELGRIIIKEYLAERAKHGGPTTLRQIKKLKDSLPF